MQKSILCLHPSNDLQKQVQIIPFTTAPRIKNLGTNLIKEVQNWYIKNDKALLKKIKT